MHYQIQHSPRSLPSKLLSACVLVLTSASAPHSVRVEVVRPEELAAVEFVHGAHVDLSSGVWRSRVW